MHFQQVDATPKESQLCKDVTLFFKGSVHQVDSITHCRSSTSGQIYLKLSMHCSCCSNREYWFSEMEIQRDGC